jgi:hypothetical protein
MHDVCGSAPELAGFLQLKSMKTMRGKVLSCMLFVIAIVLMALGATKGKSCQTEPRLLFSMLIDMVEETHGFLLTSLYHNPM